MQPEEQELTRRIVSGDTRLCARLADRYGKTVYTLVVRIVGRTEDAAIMELSEGNVKVRLHRIRKKLYLLVNDEMDGKE